MVSMLRGKKENQEGEREGEGQTKVKGVGGDADL